MKRKNHVEKESNFGKAYTIKEGGIFRLPGRRGLRPTPEESRTV